MKSIKIKYIFFVLLIAIAGCRKDESTNGSVVNEPTGDPTIEVVSGVTGYVSNENGAPISDAEVTVYNQKVKTDENGIFFVNNVGLKKTRSIVNVEKPGFYDGFKTFIPELGKKSFVQLQLVKRYTAGLIQSTTGGKVNIEGGAEVIFSENSFVIKDGGADYSGEVNVLAHWYDPTDLDISTKMPGNLLGINSEGTETQLGTYGMIAIEFYSIAGDLKFVDGKKAILKFPVSNTLTAPATIPLWYFDEMDAVWVQEGQAKLEGGFYVAEVSHFSFWNCDAPFPLVNIEGKILYQGNPIANFPVTIMVDNLISGTGFTDNEGVFIGKVPKGEILTLVIRNCEETIVSQELGSFIDDENIGSFEVELKNFITVLAGRTVDCFNKPLENAYGVLKSNTQIMQVITPKSDGTFLTTLLGCENSNYTIQFFDAVNFKSSKIYEISTNLEYQNIEDVRLCVNIDEFIIYTLDGVEKPVKLSADVYFSNGNKVIIRSYDPDVGGNFNLDFFAEGIGNYKPSSLLIDDAFIWNPEKGYECGDIIGNAFGCDMFDIKITTFDDYIEGTFSGILVSSQDTFYAVSELEEYAVEGSFRVKIDEIINTGEISGQFWIDENNNNVREDDEERKLDYYGTRLVHISGSETYLFTTLVPGINRHYKYTNLLPGTYQIRISSRDGYDPVKKDFGGDDDRDCDFGDLINGRYHSDEITITSNEIINNLDMGYKLPESVFCEDLESFGCAPNLLVYTRVSGGVPPYTATLNGEEQIIADNDPVFNVGFGGTYSIEIVDDVGNKCSTEGFVENYSSNRVVGYLWQDIEGGTPNVSDNNDKGMSDVTVVLFQENGEIFDELSGESGSYNFTNITPGNYYIFVESSGSFELVEQNTAINNGSDIDPTTGKSDVFTVGGCNSFVRIDGGFKAI